MSIQAEERASRVLKMLFQCGPLSAIELSTSPGLSALRARFPDATQLLTEVSAEDVRQILWMLIARGLVWFNTVSEHAAHWRYTLTEKGRAVASDQEPNPDDKFAYMARLTAAVPDTSDLVKMYLIEALNAYSERCFLAAIVMLGVAAEASTLETIAEFVKWADAKNIIVKKVLREPGTNYVNRLSEFHRQLTTLGSPPLPKRLADTVGIGLTGLLDLLRVTRNSVGHPTGTKIDAFECFQALYSYSGAHRRLDEWKKFFVRGTPP